MHVSEMLVNTNIPCMKCSNLRRWDSFYRTLCMLHDTRRKAEHSVTLQQRFPPLCSRFLLVVNRPAVFLSFYHIECELFAVFIKDFVRQLKAFLPSFCHSCACEMSQGGAFDHLNGPQCGAFERHFGWGKGQPPTQSFLGVRHAFLPKGLFTWSGGPRSSGVGFFCFHALGDTKQKKLTPLDRISHSM